jgi:GMP synthase (glutamine-hydrolysing)
VPKLLVLNHHGSSVSALIERLGESRASLTVVEPADVRPYSARGFDGVVASGGYLRAETYRRELDVYSRLLEDLDRPFLGICLGLKILGRHYGARMRRIAPAVGTYRVHFVREYPLAPGILDCSVYQGHQFELIPPLPDVMENYATDGSPVQAVKIRGSERYGVQFHPELSGDPACQILENFVALCSRDRP